MQSGLFSVAVGRKQVVAAGNIYNADSVVVVEKTDDGDEGCSVADNSVPDPQTTFAGA